jgi:ligand-binding sensor domain-containing protein
MTRRHQGVGWTTPAALLLGLTAPAPGRAADPWHRPDHLRASVVPTDAWSSRAVDRPIRLFWDGDARATVSVLHRGHWKTLAESVPSGFTTKPLPADAVFRVRLEDGARWSPELRASTVDDPVATGHLGGWGGADVVGQIAHDRSTGNVYASTVGGGLLVRVAGAQGLSGAQATVGEWTVLGRSDGLPDARVVSVTARDGSVLVGTARGLAHLQGTEVVDVFDEGLPDSYVQAVHIGADGAWWAGTFRGLAVRRPGEAAFAPVLTPWSVFSLSEARDGGVWAGYEGLQHVALDGTATPWLDGVHVYDSVDTAEGPVVATTEAGVMVVSVPRVATPLSRVVDRDAFGVAVGPGGIWTAAGSLGLVDPTGGLWGRGAGLPAEGVRSVSAMPDGTLFVGTDQGLARVIPRETAPLIDPRSATGWPASTPIADIEVVRDGLWVAGQAGVQVAGLPQSAARDLIVAAGDDVRAVVADLEGATWAVGERVVRLDARGALDAWWPPAKVEMGAVQEGAGLYVGGADGLWRLDTTRDRFVPISTLRDVVAVEASRRGLWVAADGNVFRVVGAVVSPYLETNVPLCLSASDDGVWVGTTDGLEHLRLTAEGAVVDDVLADSDALVAVPAVAADARGVWFATEAGQVGRIVDGRVGLVTLVDVDPPAITTLAPDGDHVWVGTDAGVYRVFLPPSDAVDPLPVAD